MADTIHADRIEAEEDKIARCKGTYEVEEKLVDSNKGSFYNFSYNDSRMEAKNPASTTLLVSRWL